MKKRKWLWIISFAVCAASGIVLLAAACSARASGHMKLTVIDAYSLRAIANARIILPEAGLSATSDQNGVAYLYGVPVRTREGALAEVPCDYGETTILFMRKATCLLRCSMRMCTQTACAMGQRCIFSGRERGRH